jgi:hypothetical protein
MLEQLDAVHKRRAITTKALQCALRISRRELRLADESRNNALVCAMSPVPPSLSEEDEMVAVPGRNSECA